MIPKILLALSLLTAVASADTLKLNLPEARSLLAGLSGLEGVTHDAKVVGADGKETEVPTLVPFEFSGNTRLAIFHDAKILSATIQDTVTVGQKYLTDHKLATEAQASPTQQREIADIVYARRPIELEILHEKDLCLDANKGIVSQTLILIDPILKK